MQQKTSHFFISPETLDRMNIDSQLDIFIRESLKRHMNGEFVDCGDRQISDYLYNDVQIWILTKNGTTSIMISGTVEEINKLWLIAKEPAAGEI
ncbi:MAG: hypothetical protein JXA07_04750 [Spirochaetes bacterium]|nr:hypothetical protein [Spirochaetota bacterium]